MRKFILCLSVALLSFRGVCDDTNFIQNLLAQITTDIAGERPHRLQNPTYTLLAFVSLEDSRPWFAEDALLLIKDDTRWILAHVVRNPRYPDGRPASKWHHHHVFDAPWSGDRVFKQKPTKEDVTKFLADNRWQWHSEPGSFQVTKRMVNDEAWIRLLDMPPPVNQNDKTGINPVLH